MRPFFYGAGVETITDIRLKILPAWSIGDVADIRLINISENRTYLVEASKRYILRQHRVGYHTGIEIESELAWSAALEADGVIVAPNAVVGCDGKIVQKIEDVHYVLSHYIDGETPDESTDLINKFHNLGAIAAKTHLHSLDWTRPEWFQRKAWDADAIFGPHAYWGQWRDAPNVSPKISAILEKAEAKTRSELAAYGQSEDVFGLIHADMRLANLLVQGDDLRLIDFDDCGFGWFFFDFAAAVSFIETRSDLSELAQSWLAGYAQVRQVSAADRKALPAFVMLRRMQLLAWIGSHMEATEPQEMAPYFAAETAQLAERFLDDALFG